jgi:hypothetical protein
VRREMPVDAEPARAGLVDEVQPAAECPQRAHHLVERLEVASDHPIVADLTGAARFGDRDVDRFLVDIHPHEHATFRHDLPPLFVALCEASNTPHNPRQQREAGQLVSIGSVSARGGESAAAEQAPSTAGPAEAAVE